LKEYKHCVEKHLFDPESGIKLETIIDNFGLKEYYQFLVIHIFFRGHKS